MQNTQNMQNYYQIIKKFNRGFALNTLRAIAVILVFSLVYAFSACGSAAQSGQNLQKRLPNASVLNSNPKNGGTLTILSSESKMDFDPARSQGLPITSNSLVFRALTTWKVTPSGKTRVVADLATDTGTALDGGKTWKYTLKKGIKYQDGSPITSKDIKYGLERSFANSLTGGFGYHKALLEGAKDYAGPFSGKSLDSIETPDNQTIIFKLNAAFANWPWVASLAAFAPVPLNSGNAQDYGKSPVASGPYKIVENEAGKQIVMVRNTNWDSSADSIRANYPDKIIWKLGVDPSVAAQSMIQGNSGADNAILADFVPPAQRAQAKASYKSSNLLVTSGDGALEYLAMNNRRIKDVKIRKAIQYAVDKQSYQRAKGGAVAGGFATTLITPGVSERKVYNLYSANPRGDVEKAKQLLKESGKSKLKFSLIARPDQAQVASSIQASLKRVGIDVSIRTVDSQIFTDMITGDSGDYDLALSKWQPDFPSAYANIGPLFDSSQIGGGNWNISRYSNPKVDSLIHQAVGVVDKSRADLLWQQVDKEIMRDSPIVPLIYSKNTYIHGSNVENFFVGSFPAYPNYARVSLRN